jgi:hypothetical protein
MKTLEEQAEEFAKKRVDLDPIYANGLYYGFIECAKSEWFKEQINEAYNQGQMDGFGLEEKDDYHNEKYGQINKSE